MATEIFSATQEAGLTVYFRFVRPVDGWAFDFDTNAWVSTVAGATTPELSATESTDLGDADNSVYTASLNLALLNPNASSMGVIVQTCDDADDSVLGQKEFWIVAGADIRGIPDVLAFAASTMKPGTAIAGTLTTTQMTTDLTETEVGAYNDRVVAFRSGVLDGQVAEISGYDGSGGLTFSAVTQPMSADDLFVIV